jgi:hypothetical protein
MFNGKDVGKIVLVMGGILGCELNTDLKVAVCAVEECGLICPTRWLQREKMSSK